MAPKNHIENSGVSLHVDLDYTPSRIKQLHNAAVTVCSCLKDDPIGVREVLEALGLLDDLTAARRLV